jgi:DNA polymerase-3 subunit delta
MTGRELVSWVEGFLSKLGKSIEPGAAAALTELQGNNLLSMTQELEKLASFSGKRKSITAEDVEELTGRSLAASAFDITRAIDGNKIDDAMKICSDLIRTGRKEHEIVGLLCWHLRRVLKAKMMQARGLGTGQIALAMNVGRRYQDEFFRQVSGLKTARIRSRIMALLDADLDIKRTRLNPRIVLEIAVIRLCLC